MRPRLLIILTFVLTFLRLPAQNMDSLQRVANGNGADTARLDATLAMLKAWTYDQLPKVLAEGRKAIAMAEKIGDEKRKAWALNYIGSAYYYKSRYDSSEYYHRQALAIRLRIDDPKGLGASYNNLGLILDDKGKTAEALDYYQKALAEFEKANYALGTAVVNNSLGNLYYYQKNLAKALPYFQASHDINKKLGNEYGVMTALNNIALIYSDQKQNQKALDLLLQVRKMAEEQQNDDVLTTALNNISVAYIDLGRFDEAEPVVQLSLEKAIAANDSFKQISPLVNLGKIVEHRGFSDSAIVLFERGVQLARTLHMQSYVKETLDILSNAWAAKGDYKKAFDYRLQYDVAKDSVYADDKRKSMLRLEVQYGTEQIRKEKELSDQKYQQVRQRNLFIGVIGSCIALGALFAVYALRRSRRMNHLLGQQKIEILDKNRDLSQKNAIIEQQHDEITSSIEYARNIQRALLPDDDEVKVLFPESFVFFLPRDIVSGDFYFIAQKNGDTYFAVADCTGHGVPGALMSMIGVEKLEENLPRANTPGELLALVNRSVKSALRQDGTEGRSRDGMDIALCRYSPTTRQLTYAGANRPLWLVRKGELIEIKSTKTAIAGFTPDDQIFTDHMLPTEPGDMIYLFSDGFADQFGGETGKKLMTKNMRQLLVRISDRSADAQKNELVETFQKWKGNFEQVDDVLVVGIRIS